MVSHRSLSSVSFDEQFYSYLNEKSYDQILREKAVTNYRKEFQRSHNSLGVAGIKKNPQTKVVLKNAKTLIPYNNN